MARFWGTRGSLPVPGPGTVLHGGNTACIEVRVGDRLLILDAGSGLRPLGRALAGAGGAVEAEILLSHTHSDHLCGLGFFAPLYAAGNRVRVRAGHLPQAALEGALRAAFSEPLCPDLPGSWRAAHEVLAFRAGETLAPGGGIAVRTAPLRHPGGATGYRIEAAGRALAYVTDHEHVPGEDDPGVLALARDADLLIYDATYTEAEFPARRGWGHSTWEEAVRVGALAGARRVALFHHAPEADDAALAAVAEAARRRHPGAFAAREGQSFLL